ncbi:hypothetical protein ES705_07268 [subsurface metagenome]
MAFFGHGVTGAKEFCRWAKLASKGLGDREIEDALMQGGFVFEREIKKNIKSQGLIDSGNMRDSVQARPDPVDRPAVEVGPTVVYAAIHEFGGVTHPRVTARMRGFAWHMFYETGEPMWRGLALTKKTFLTVSIPARPYMRPALDDKGKAAAEAVAVALRKIIEGTARRHGR